MVEPRCRVCGGDLSEFGRCWNLRCGVYEVVKRQSARQGRRLSAGIDLGKEPPDHGYDRDEEDEE